MDKIHSLWCTSLFSVEKVVSGRRWRQRWCRWRQKFIKSLYIFLGVFRHKNFNSNPTENVLYVFFSYLCQLFHGFIEKIILININVLIIRRLCYLVTFLTETTYTNDLIFGLDIHRTSGSVIGYIILTLQVI